MEYTKGKWTVKLAQPYDEHEFEVSYDTEDGLTYPIADVHGKLERGDAEANAQLIASAPDLYEALKTLNGLLTGANIPFSQDMFDAKINMREALAKAKGD